MVTALFIKTQTLGPNDERTSPDIMDDNSKQLSSQNVQDRKSKVVKKMSQSKRVTIIYCVVLLLAAIAWFIMAVQSHGVMEDRTHRTGIISQFHTQFMTQIIKLSQVLMC